MNIVQNQVGGGISFSAIPFNESLKIEAGVLPTGEIESGVYFYRYYMTSGVLAAYTPYVEPLSTADIEV
jgi:hypothetical protein